jgi:hypothetical protein
MGQHSRVIVKPGTEEELIVRVRDLISPYCTFIDEDEITEDTEGQGWRGSKPMCFNEPMGLVDLNEGDKIKYDHLVTPDGVLTKDYGRDSEGMYRFITPSGPTEWTTVVVWDFETVVRRSDEFFTLGDKIIAEWRAKGYIALCISNRCGWSVFDEYESVRFSGDKRALLGKHVDDPELQAKLLGARNGWVRLSPRERVLIECATDDLVLELKARRGVAQG